MPQLRRYLNWMTFDDLPGAPASGPERLDAIRAAGYDGVQFVEPLTPEQRRACDRLALRRCGFARIDTPADADPAARNLAAEAHDCATVHAGWGLESDAQAAALIQAILEAQDRHRIPLYVETHRATLFQDMWRTVEFVRRFPALRFNGDFSHWYTGQEMVYGGFENKLEFIRPVLDRVAFLHGRIGNPGCIQVDIGDGDHQARPYVAHFRALWTAAFEGFLRRAESDAILFVPELLSPRIYYARTFHAQEESDRWTQSLVLKRIAAECFAAARENLQCSNP